VWTAPSSVEVLLTESLALGGATGLVTTHGDLHHRNILIDGGHLSGVIDWTDLGLNAPGVDFILYWSLLDRVARTAFRAEYGPISERDLTIGRVLAVNLCAMLALFCHQRGDAPQLKVALEGLNRSVLPD
jgi:hypothetical protein